MQSNRRPEGDQESRDEEELEINDGYIVSGCVGINRRCGEVTTRQKEIAAIFLSQDVEICGRTPGREGVRGLEVVVL